MSNTYTLFYRDGRVAFVIRGAFHLVIAPSITEWDGYHYEGEYDGTYYFHEGVPIKRPQNPTSLNGLTLLGVPAGSNVHIDREIYECISGGDIELQFHQPGTYRVAVESWPYLDKEFEIDYQPQS